MSYGFLALNDDNDVLISSDTKNLHFAGKATKPSSAYFSFNNHGQHHELHYTITFPNRTSVPVPYFTMAGSVGFYSIAGVVGANSGSSSKTWTIKIIMSGVIQSTGGNNDFMPDVYIFTDPSAISVSGSYGFQVFNSDGTVSFDSRAQPLVVVGAHSAIPPLNPLSSSSAVTLSATECGDINNNAFTPVNSNSLGIGLVADHPSKPMYHFNALPQTEREIAFSQSSSSCTGIGSVYGECIGYVDSTSVLSTYWCFYRAGIGKNFTQNVAGGSGQRTRCGWIPVQAGCHWTSSSSGGFFFNIFGPGSSSSTGGAFPYSNETINLVAQDILVADASRYD